MKPQIIAFYLPQFYPFEENDKWWGKGFTEWTSVGKAKPLFDGHYQPRVPADLGYYDLRDEKVREQQAQLAQEAGVTAFCYWHYWFGNGKRLLSQVFDEVLESGAPDFPFCLGWANHSWYKKTWVGVKEDKLLMEQTYPGIEDAKMHFNFLKKAFSDHRYLKIDGKPFFYIFDPESLPEDYIINFRAWSKEAGFKDLYIVANVFNTDYPPERYTAKGLYDAVVYNRLSDILYKGFSSYSLIKKKVLQGQRYIKQIVTGKPRGAINYAKTYHQLITNQEQREDVIPELIPQWDHSPRSADRAAVICYNSTPEYFYKHVLDVLNAVVGKPEKNQIILLKSWNEWGEGNYMEPDLKFGKGYIKALRKALDDYDK